VLQRGKQTAEKGKQGCWWLTERENTLQVTIFFNFDKNLAGQVTLACDQWEGRC
jgi:hypothetical protein